MTPEVLDLTGLEAQLAGLGPAVRTAAPGPALRGVAQAVAAAVRAVHQAPTGGDPDADWIATRAGGRLTVFGPDLLIQTTFDGSAVVSARAVADERALQCDYGDPTARADPDPTRLLEAGLGGIADRLRGAALGKIGVTMGGIRVRLTEGGQTLGDWMFDDAGTGEPVEEIAAREMDDAAQRLEDDLGRADEPENMAPRTDARGVADQVTRGTGGGISGGIAGAATAGVGSAAAAAAARALVRKARAKRRDPEPTGTDQGTVRPDQGSGRPEALGRTCPACGRAARPEQRFCAECGAALAETADTSPGAPTGDARGAAPDEPPSQPPTPPPQPVQPAEPSQPVPPPPPPPEPPTWRPTHAVLPGGVNARATADPQAPVTAQLAPGIRLAVVRVWGAWSEVVAENGWSGWVDGRRLTPLG